MLETVIPAYEELWFRQRMLSDEATMSYNHAWGGTISFPEEKWQAWYDYWIVNHDNQRYYRYLKNENDDFVGEIAYHYDPEYHEYVADVIVLSEFRRKGYGSQGLEILCKEAKENGIFVLLDDIAIDNPAINLFLKHGFSESKRTEEKIIMRKNL